MKNVEKKQREKDAGLMAVRFSIGAKLIIIISIIVLISLGLATALMSWLVREDLRLAAEENNFEVNRRSAIEADNTFAKMRSDSLMLMQVVVSLGAESARARQTEEFFFGQNPQVGALFFTADGQADYFFVNNSFFLSRKIDLALTDSFRENYREALKRAASGEITVLNASPWFSTTILALFFPWRNGGGAVLFSPEDLHDSYSFGVNQSYLINSSGDILVHADYELLLAGANVAEKSFTQYIWDNPAQNAQTLFTDEEGTRFFGAFTKINTGGCTVVTAIDYNRVFEGIDATARRNLYLTAAVLCLSILIIRFFAKRISAPLKELAAAAQTVEGGGFEVELHPGKRRDEVGVLSASFRRMCTALGIFGRFTNRDIAVRAMRGEIKPGGFQKHATVFFSDIRGFTEISENFTKTFENEASGRIVQWLNEYFTRMVECIEKTGGVVDKFIGDAVMAHWGTAYTAGSPQKDALNCIEAALMMREVLVEMNKNRKAGDPANPPIKIGCGINTGIVTVGQIGSDQRMEYTVIGDPVNIASRTESLNKSLGTDILIAEDTWSLVKDYVVTEEMPAVNVKGKEKPLRVFSVVSRRDRDER